MTLTVPHSISEVHTICVDHRKLGHWSRKSHTPLCELRQRGFKLAEVDPPVVGSVNLVKDGEQLKVSLEVHEEDAELVK